MVKLLGVTLTEVQRLICWVLPISVATQSICQIGSEPATASPSAIESRSTPGERTITLTYGYLSEVTEGLPSDSSGLPNIRVAARGSRTSESLRRSCATVRAHPHSVVIARLQRPFLHPHWQADSQPLRQDECCGESGRGRAPRPHRAPSVIPSLMDSSWRI